MPGHASSPYWATVDFDSEGEEEKSPSSNRRVYVDPWGNETGAPVKGELSESSHGDNMNSFVGEPISASFYYVPTKTCDADENPKVSRRSIIHDEVPPDYGYGRRVSRHAPNLIYQDIPAYNPKPIQRRRSVYIEEPIYAPHSILYESVYTPLPVPPAYVHPRHRVSLQHQPEYVSANIYGKQRRHSRLADVYEQYGYDVHPEYEDWARPTPKTAPDNFHLSRYGHLRIDYSCSWNSLDRIIRNQ